MKPRSSSRGSVQVSNPLLEQNAVRIQQTYASPTLRSSACRVRELESSKDEYYYWIQQQENAELAWPAVSISYLVVLAHCYSMDAKNRTPSKERLCLLITVGLSSWVVLEYQRWISVTATSNSTLLTIYNS